VVHHDIGFEPYASSFGRINLIGWKQSLSTDGAAL